MSTVKTLTPVYAKGSYGTYHSTPRVHQAETHSWHDAAGDQRVVMAKTLCGARAGQKAEADAPVNCPRCRARQREREAEQ